MEMTESADGTGIAFERSGRGPSLVLVAGAFCDRISTHPLAEMLVADLTVFEYDRRGRGMSGDAPDYAVEREIEDLGAVIDAAGGAAMVYGHSSGAALAVDAAAHGAAISKLAVYEPPYATTPTDKAANRDLLVQLKDAIDHGRREDAAELHLAGSGMPGEVIEMIKASPGWPTMVALAHTLAYDRAITGRGIRQDLFAGIEAPTLVLCGDESPDYLQQGAAATASAIAGARSEIVQGQGHNGAPEVLAPRLTAWFSSPLP